MHPYALVAVLIAIFSPAALYFWLALRERRRVVSLDDFFPLTRFVRGDQYGRSTAAAGVSLATVILALVNLVPFFGLGLFITIASYAFSFVILYFCAPIILRSNPQNDTVQAFLGRMYESKAVQRIAVVFCFLGYISIFSMELLVGVTVLEPFLGKTVYIFSAIYLLFIIGYSLLSGFRAIVATEQWQIRFIVAAVSTLIVLVLIQWSNAGDKVSFGGVSRALLSSSTLTWSFAIGIIALNLPAPISDSGTWQRLCSTSSEADARRGLLRAICLFVFIWGTLILCASYIAQFAVATGQFSSSSGTLMTFIVSTFASQDWWHLALLFVFILGLFAAMITTADSLLMVAAQMISLDLLRIRERPMGENDKINFARMVLAGIAVASFLLFGIFRLLNFDVVQLIFSIYGAQLALFPAVAVALFLRKWIKVDEAAPAAAISILVGFISAWSSALYGKFSQNSDWLYNAPVVALLASSLVFCLLSTRAWRLSKNVPRSDTTG